MLYTNLSVEEKKIVERRERDERPESSSSSSSGNSSSTRRRRKGRERRGRRRRRRRRRRRTTALTDVESLVKSCHSFLQLPFFKIPFNKCHLYVALETRHEEQETSQTQNKLTDINNINLKFPLHFLTNSPNIMLAKCQN